MSVVTSGDNAENDPGRNEVKKWLREIEQAEQAHKDYRERAKCALDIYEGKTKSENSFNILYSNTEILAPAVYSQLPKAEVKRRFSDEDPLAAAAGKAVQRMLEYQLDTPDAQYRSCNDLFNDSVLQGLVPGMASLRIKYEPVFEEMEPAPGQVELPPTKEAIEGEIVSSSTEKDGDQDDVGDLTQSNKVIEPPPLLEKVKYETLCLEVVAYDEQLFGPGKVWQDKPWIGYVHDMTKADVSRAFGAEIAGKMIYDEAKKPDSKESMDSKQPEMPKSVRIYEIWHRTSKRVIFVSQAYPDRPLKVVHDPLRVPGFFPQAEPLIYLKKSRKFEPTVLYDMYENQAKELNKISLRINKLISMMKVRGFYNAAFKNELKDLLDGDETEYHPLENPLLMDGSVKLDNQFWTMPLDDCIKAIRELYGDRQEIKTVIYEITGISDIVRGSSMASETLGAQQIKQQWGTMRISRMQTATAMFIRNTLRVMADVAVAQFSDETWAAMTQLPYLTGKQVAQLQEQIAAATEAAKMAPAPQPDPANPQAPPAPSSEMQQIEQLQQAASQTTWEQVLGLLRDDMQRQYRIDVETNSTLATESSEDKQNITDVTAAIGSVVQGFTPLIQQGMPVSALKALLLGVSRRFRLGEMFEEQVAAMPDQMPPAPPPPPPPPDPAAEAESAAKVKVAELKIQEVEAEHAARMEEIAADKEMKQLEMDIKRQELMMQKQRLDMEFAQAEKLAAVKSEADIMSAALSGATDATRPGSRDAAV